MKMKSVTVTFGATINTGNYTNLRPEITLTADLEDGDLPKIATHDLMNQAQRMVIEQIHGLAQMQVNDLTAPFAEGDDPKQIDRWLENQTPLYTWLKEYDPTIKLLPKLAGRCPECGLPLHNGVCGSYKCPKCPNYEPPIVHTDFKKGWQVLNIETNAKGKVIAVSSDPAATEPYQVQWDDDSEPEWVEAHQIEVYLPF